MEGLIRTTPVNFAGSRTPHGAAQLFSMMRAPCRSVIFAMSAREDRWRFGSLAGSREPAEHVPGRSIV